jgi:hypothetical protein
MNRALYEGDIREITDQLMAMEVGEKKDFKDVPHWILKEAMFNCPADSMRLRHDLYDAPGGGFIVKRRV